MMVSRSCALAPMGKHERDCAVDILHPYPEEFVDPVRWAKGGIYPLMPYSNRIANATLQVNGEKVVLKAHPNAAPHSLHGNAHVQPWQVKQSDTTRVVMTLDSPAGETWPWRYTGNMCVMLSPGELLVRIDVRNADTRLMPAGIGLHPYFRHYSRDRASECRPGDSVRSPLLGRPARHAAPGGHRPHLRHRHLDALQFAPGISLISMTGGRGSSRSMGRQKGL
jgi:hypothetical protein